MIAAAAAKPMTVLRIVLTNSFVVGEAAAFRGKHSNAGRVAACGDRRPRRRAALVPAEPFARSPSTAVGVGANRLRALRYIFCVRSGALDESARDLDLVWQEVSRILDASESRQCRALKIRRRRSRAVSARKCSS